MAMQTSFENDILDHEGSLESQHIIELQAFIERRTWIEEKIRFLESLQPVELFSGAGELSTSNGLPESISSAQLAEWLVEHDKIERETEMFDSGDLQKLKGFTKAATQRNLSAEDTDLIELTLTTIYALDRLLQLLRDRSEKLDLLSLRLRWEEHRISCWTQRRMILNDLRSFLHTYAEIYITVFRNHMASMGTRSNKASLSAQNPNALCISSCTKLLKAPENMALEASSLFKRIIALKEGDVAASAQTLDKLVNDSHLPVPELFLDEQDRIDDECGNELVDLGDFAVSIAVQWKKAYEFHSELLQDEERVYEIFQDLKVALSRHPNGFQNSSFISRLEDLKLLLHSRNISTISDLRQPRCVNLIIPEQMELTKSIFQTLRIQFNTVVESSKEAENLAKEYNETWETVKRSDDLLRRLETTRHCLENIEEQLRNGAFFEERNNILEPRCLENKALPEYLSKCTSFFECVLETDLTANNLIQSARLLSLELDRPGVDIFLRQSLSDSIEAVHNKRLQISRLKAELSYHVDNLHQIYPIYSVMQGCMIRVRTTIGELQEAMFRTQWLYSLGEITNYSDQNLSILCLPLVKMELYDCSHTLDELRLTYEMRIISPLSTMNQLPPKFTRFLKSSSAKLLECLDIARSMNALLVKLSDQSLRMKVIQFDVCVLEARLDKFNRYLGRKYLRILSKPHEAEDILTFQSETLSTMTLLRRDIQEFLDTLSRRIPLIAAFHSQEVRSLKINTTLRHEGVHFRLTIDPIAIDQAVHLRCNAYTVRLSGHIRILEGKIEKMSDLTTRIEHFDDCISSFVLILQNLTLQQNDIALELTNFEKQQSLTGTKNDTLLESIVTFKEKAEITVSSHQSELESLRISAHQAVAQLQSWKLTEDEGMTSQLIEPRFSAMDELEQLVAKFIAKSRDLYTDLRKVVPSMSTSLPSRSLHKIIEHNDKLDQINDDSQHCPKDDPFSKTRIVDSATGENLNYEAKADSQCLLNDIDGLHAAENLSTSQIATSVSKPALVEPTDQLNDRINSIRSRLCLISSDALKEAVGLTQHQLFAALSSNGKRSAAMKSLAEISEEIQRIISLANNSVAASELSCLSLEAETLSRKLYLMECLGDFSTSVHTCDSDLSDLLNFIDNFEIIPSEGVERDDDFPIGLEKQMLDRLGHSESLLSCMSDLYRGVDENPLVVQEYKRVFQTWSELKEMALDRLNGLISRPLSSRSSEDSIKDDGRSEMRISSADRRVTVSALHTKDVLLMPLLSMRSVSRLNTGLASTVPLNVRSKKRSNRSVSGPMTSSLYSSTFSSRQRTASMSSTSSAMHTPVNLRPERISNRRADSPAYSESPFKSNVENLARTKPHSAFSRTPKVSLKSIHRDLQIQESGQRFKRKYVANPNNKLDVAVGNVVNCLPVDINVQVVADTWKDQSGKYWIGDADPRLCFCRILRSQTVMVRVGGGWTELSKFIQSHFADLFQLIPKHPAPAKNDVDKKNLTPEITTTPEPSIPDIPSFTLSTPNKGSPQSLKSASSVSSPLTPLQFMRRADVDAPDLSSLSLSKGSMLRSKVPNYNTPSRTAVWRP